MNNGDVRSIRQEILEVLETEVLMYMMGVWWLALPSAMLSIGLFVGEIKNNMATWLNDSYPFI